MNGVKVRRRPTVVEARRFQNDVFTKREWLEWCPDADIGSPGQDYEHGLAGRDFNWFQIPGYDGSVNVNHGDWLVKEAGKFLVFTNAEFKATFEAAYG